MELDLWDNNSDDDFLGVPQEGDDFFGFPEANVPIDAQPMDMRNISPGFLPGQPEPSPQQDQVLNLQQLTEFPLGDEDDNQNEEDDQNFHRSYSTSKHFFLL